MWLQPAVRWTCLGRDPVMTAACRVAQGHAQIAGAWMRNRKRLKRHQRFHQRKDLCQSRPKRSTWCGTIQPDVWSRRGLPTNSSGRVAPPRIRAWLPKWWMPSSLISRTRTSYPSYQRLLTQALQIDFLPLHYNSLTLISYPCIIILWHWVVNPSPKPSEVANTPNTYCFIFLYFNRMLVRIIIIHAYESYYGIKLS